MRRPLLVVLAVSLAFNLAVAVAVGARLLAANSEATGAAAAGCSAPMPHANSPEVVALCSRMQCQLQELRLTQGEETRRLAELLAAAEPDRESIDRCVVRLGELELCIQRLVVDTVLRQMAALPPDARVAFSEHVRGRLCAPWSGCGMTAPDDQPTANRDPDRKRGRN